MLELEIIDALCRGIDPRTGKNLNTPRDPKVDKLRLSFFDALKRLDKAVAKSKVPKKSINQKGREDIDTEHPNHGKTWTETEEQKLLDCFTQGMTLEAMEPFFGRNAERWEPDWSRWRLLKILMPWQRKIFVAAVVTARGF